MSTTPSATPPSTPTIHCPVNYLNESWCDIQYKSGCSSTGSISHLHHTVNPEILEKLLYEAQREANSPTHLQKGLLPDLTNSSDSCMIESVHNQLDTSTPMLVTFETGGSGALSPIISKAPTSPIIKSTEDYIAKSLTLAVLSDCTQCTSQKQQIARLLELQQNTEKQLNALRKEYENQCLSKSPDFMNQSSRSSISSSSISEDQDHETIKKSSPIEQMFPSLKRQNSSTATLVQLSAHNANINSYASGIFINNTNPMNSNSETAADWTKYWSSRPQKQPPKEWNFVHPNIAKSKLNNMPKIDSDESVEEKPVIAKYINCDSVSKILFTHMASFIVGATLMFLVLRRHFNMRSSIFMK